MTQQQPKEPPPQASIPGAALPGPTARDNMRPRRPFLIHDKPLFFAHQGGGLLAPENTLLAFEQGVACGADALELDIQTTSEGEIIVLHDPTVDRTTNGTGPVAAYTLAELRRLDAGYHFTADGGKTYPYRGQGLTIPTLREVLERFPQTRINIDLKESSPARERHLWELIQEFHAEDRVLVACASGHAPIVRFRKYSEGRVATAASAWEIRLFLLSMFGHVSRWLRLPYDALQVPELYGSTRVISPALVQTAHQCGLEVHVWTVNDRPSMERLLAMGVDGIMTDRPDILAQVLAERKQ